MMIENFMTVEEMCSTLTIGKNSAYKLAKKMRWIKVGRKLMVPRADVDKYIMNLLKEREDRMKKHK